MAALPYRDGVTTVSREGILATERLIRERIRETPVIAARGSDFGLAADRLLFKLESCQHSGSFKVRGAFANLLLRDIPDGGIYAASGGNHGVAVAFAARELGVSATIFVPTVASPVKLAKIEGYGARLVVAGDRYDDALAASRRWAETANALELHAFDSPETLLGQGTVATELERQTDIDTLLVAVGGGGLIGGIAAYFSERVANGSLTIIGVEPESAPTLTNAINAGHPVDSPAGGIAADSLAPKRVGKIMFPIAQKYVDRVILVSDDEIRDAQKALWDQLCVVAEPGGAAALAALLSRKFAPRSGERIGILVCGGNTKG